MVFKNWHCVLPEDGTLVLKHDGHAHVKFVLIKTLYLVGTIHGVC